MRQNHNAHQPLSPAHQPLPYQGWNGPTLAKPVDPYEGPLVPPVIPPGNSVRNDVTQDFGRLLAEEPTDREWALLDKAHAYRNVNNANREAPAFGRTALIGTFKSKSGLEAPTARYHGRHTRRHKRFVSGV